MAAFVYLIVSVPVIGFRVTEVAVQQAAGGIGAVAAWHGGTPTVVLPTGQFA